jgi:hypothetical protein
MAVRTKRRADGVNEVQPGDETRMIRSGWCNDQEGHPEPLHQKCPELTTSHKIVGGTVTYLCNCPCHKKLRKVRKPLSMRRKANRNHLEGRRKARRPE